MGSTHTASAGGDEAPGTASFAPSVLAGRYEMGDLLGQGGSAQVYRAWDGQLERTVAVKLFAPGISGPERHRQAHELHTVAGLSHPGLVELYDAGTDDGRSYLVMQLVEGSSLAQRLQEDALPVATVAAMGAAMADTLAYIHHQGVTHRDLKPANVLLDEHDHPRLTDFGIELLVDTTRVTATGVVIGTAAYMAPEQVLGEQLGPPVDVYSLGRLLLEAITGRPEYPGTGVESACARLHRPPAVPDDLPAGLAPVLTTMTATEPAQRPAADAVAQALHASVAELHGGPPAGYTALLAAPARPARATRRRRLALAGAATAVAGIAASLIGLAAWDTTPGSAESSATIAPPPTAQQPPEVGAHPSLRPTTAEARQAPAAHAPPLNGPSRPRTTAPTTAPPGVGTAPRTGAPIDAGTSGSTTPLPTTSKTSGDGGGLSGGHG